MKLTNLLRFISGGIPEEAADTRYADREVELRLLGVDANGDYELAMAATSHLYDSRYADDLGIWLDNDENDDL